MGLEYNVRPNEDVFIRIALAKADTGLYPQAKIYAIDDPDTVVDTVNLTERSNGLYGKAWTNNGERKKYFTQVIVYTDSGYTTEHPIIRPDSDSINVGYATTGGVFGSSRRGSNVIKSDLTKEEIDRIAKAVFKILKPELDKKSEFNPSADLVKTNLEIPAFPEIPNPTSASEISNLVKEALNLKTKEINNKIDSIKPDYSSNFDDIKETIIKNKIAIPELIDFSGELENINTKIDEVNDLAKSNSVLLQGIKEIKKKELLGKEQVIKGINSGEDSISVYKKFQQLSVKEKQYVFNILSVENPSLLKRLDNIATADKILKDIKKSPSKIKTLTKLLSSGKITKDLIPYIKSLNV